MGGMFWAAIKLVSAATACTELHSDRHKYYLFGKTELAEW